MSTRDLPVRERIALPLDVDGLEAARAWVAELRAEVGLFKVGLELYTAVGPAAVEAVHEAGARTFLDLKLHDIPATMAGAVRRAAALGVRYLTVHASAGPAALRACAEAAGPAMTVLAVTVLTSLDAGELDAIGLSGTPEAAAVRLARVADAAGIGGLVCSPAECAPIRAAIGERMVLVVPGIRPAGSSADDQRRTGTPTDAIASGADVLVVGRPIRSAPDPLAATRAIRAEIEAALGRRGPR